MTSDFTLEPFALDPFALDPHAVAQPPGLLDPMLFGVLTAAVEEESVLAYEAGFSDGLRAARDRLAGHPVGPDGPEDPDNPDASGILDGPFAP